MAGEHAGHRQRMRARFREQGLAGFAPHEVLELILFYAIPQRNVNPLAHRLIDRFGSLHGVLEASPEELATVEGVGEYAATLLSLFSHVERMVQKSRQGAKKELRSRKEMEEHCRQLLDGLKEEHFYIVCLDAQMHVIRDVLIAKGTIDEVHTYPRAVAQAVLTHNAHAVILCHNHPGGSIIPSQQDLDMTAELSTLLASMRVALVDHVVVAGGETLSMTAHKLIVHSQSETGLYARVADPGQEIMVRRRLEKNMEKKK